MCQVVRVAGGPYLRALGGGLIFFTQIAFRDGPPSTHALSISAPSWVAVRALVHGPLAG